MGAWLAPLVGLLRKHWTIIALTASFLLWLRAHDRQVRYEALAEARLEQVNQIVSQLDRARTTLAQRDSVIHRQEQEIERKRGELAVRERQAKQATTAAVGRLRNELDEQQEAMLDTIVKGYEAQLSLAHQQMQKTQELLDLANAQIAHRDSLIINYEQATRTIHEYYRKEVNSRKDGLLQKAERILPWIITAGAIIAR